MDTRPDPICFIYSILLKLYQLLTRRLFIQENNMETCKLCENEVESIAYVAEKWLIEIIKEKNPQWVAPDGACQKCIDYYKGLDNIAG